MSQNNKKIDLKVEIVSFPFHQKQTSIYMNYNLYRKKISNTKKLSKIIINNPILGKNCTLTTCYIDLIDLSQYYNQNKYKCKNCKRYSQSLLLDVGLKQFIQKFKNFNLLKEREAPYAVYINPKTYSYKISMIETGMIAYLSTKISNQIYSKVSSWLNFLQEFNQKKFCYSKLSSQIKQAVLKTDEKQQSQQPLRLYSWCRHVQNEKCYLLLFFQGEKQPRKIQVKFDMVQNKANDLLTKVFSLSYQHNAVMSYYSKQKIFIAILTTRSNTYYFRSSLKPIADKLNLVKKTLTFMLIQQRETKIRKYPSLLIDQNLGKFYVLGGLDEKAPQKKPFKIIQYQDMIWDKQCRIKRVENTSNLFSSQQKRAQFNNTIRIGIRGATIIRYSPCSQVKSQSTNAQEKRQKVKQQEITWFCFGGSFCYQGGLLSIKVANQKPGIRTIEYKIQEKKDEKKNKKKIIYNKNPHQVIVQQKGRSLISFDRDYPLVIQIPQIGNQTVDKKNKNKVLVLGGCDYFRSTKKQQNKMANNTYQKKQKVFIFDLHNNSVLQLPETKYAPFPIDQLQKYYDINSTIFKSSQNFWYIRMTYPCKKLPDSQKYRYLVVQYNIEKRQLKHKFVQFQ